MATVRNKWPVAAGIAITAVATLAAVYFHDQRLTDITMPTIPTPDHVAELSAAMNGTAIGLPVTDRFPVPKEFRAEVCGYFAGQPSKWSLECSEDAIQTLNLGQLHFELLGGGHLDLSFYTVGKGAIGFSIGHDYYTAATGNHDGGSSLLFVLERARQAAGVPLPPPYPPPINTDDNIVALIASIVQSDSGEPATANFAVPVGYVSRVMRWLQGRLQTVPDMWPESQRLGVLNVTLKSGAVVAVSYYRSPAREVRFSISATPYRALNPNSAGSETINQEIRSLIQDLYFPRLRETKRLGGQ